MINVMLGIAGIGKRSLWPMVDTLVIRETTLLFHISSCITQFGLQAVMLYSLIKITSYHVWWDIEIHENASIKNDFSSSSIC